MEININEVFPLALRLERENRFTEAVSLLYKGYELANVPIFLFEVICILIYQDHLEEARKYLNELTQNHEFEPAEKLLSVVNYMFEEGNVKTIIENDVEFLLPITGHNWEIESEWIQDRFYEPTELKYLKENIPSNTTLIDIGANVGNHALYIAKHRPDLKISVFEPEPRACLILQKIMDINNVSNVDTSKLGYAISANTRPLLLQFRNSLTSTRRSNDNEGLEVPCLTLRELLDESTKFIKIDIEGMEKEVLLPAIDKLFDNEVSIMLEVLSQNKDEYEQFFIQNGFTVVDRIKMHAGENVIIKAVQG